MLQIWMKSARLEWCLGELERAAEMLAHALREYPDTPKLHLMAGQIAEQRGELAAARLHYQAGVRRMPHSIPLWLHLCRSSSITFLHSLIDLNVASGWRRRRAA